MSAERVTHGRHCLCGACARQDWAEPQLAPCGMHGSSCPPVYAPLGVAGAIVGKLPLGVSHPLRCEWPLPGGANVKRQGDPLALDIMLSSIRCRHEAIARAMRAGGFGTRPVPVGHSEDAGRAAD